MATTANFKLTSTDLVSQGVSVDITTNLYKADTTTNIEGFTGTRVITLASSGSPATIKLVEADDYTDNKSAKVYIYNANTAADDYAIVDLGTVVTGRLYPGDWCLFPYAGLVDVNITPKASTAVKIEYCVLGGA